LVLADSLVHRLVAGVVLLLVDDLLAGSHYCVALLACWRVAARIATGGTAAVPGRAAVSSLCRVGPHDTEDDRNYRHTQQRSHVSSLLRGQLRRGVLVRRGVFPP